MLGIQKKYKNIGDSGCYFLDLLEAFGKVDKAIEYYDKYVSKGWMDEDCFVKNPLDIVKDLSGHPNWKLVKTTTFDKNATLAIAYFCSSLTKLHHFVIIDKNKNVIYDSLGDSNTVKNGYIESYRLFYEVK